MAGMILPAINLLCNRNNTHVTLQRISLQMSIEYQTVFLNATLKSPHPKNSTLSPWAKCNLGTATVKLQFDVNWDADNFWKSVAWIRFQWSRLNVISKIVLVIKLCVLNNNWSLFLFLKLRDSKVDLGFGQWDPLQVYRIRCSSGSGGGPRGPWSPPGPVKIGHKKDGRQRRPHRFHVSRPPSYPAAGSATEVTSPDQTRFTRGQIR